MNSLPDFRVVLRTPIVDDFWKNNGIGKTSTTLSGQKYLEFLRKEYPSFRLRAPSVYNTHHNWQEVNRFFDIASVPRNGFYVGDVHKDASRLKAISTFRRVVATLQLHRLKETEEKGDSSAVKTPKDVVTKPPAVPGSVSAKDTVKPRIVNLPSFQKKESRSLANDVTLPRNAGGCTFGRNLDHLVPKEGNASEPSPTPNRRLTFVKIPGKSEENKEEPKNEPPKKIEKLLINEKITKRFEDARKAKSPAWIQVCRAVYFGVHTYTTCPQLGCPLKDKKEGDVCPFIVEGIRPSNHTSRLQKAIITSFAPQMQWSITIGANTLVVSLEEVIRHVHTCDSVIPEELGRIGEKEMKELFIQGLSLVRTRSCTSPICIQLCGLLFRLPSV